MGRTRQEFVTGIFEDLDWLGLTWEEPVVFQSQRFEAYRAAARLLEALGLLNPCFATRSEIEAAAAPGALDPDGAPLYPGPWPGLWKGRAASEVARMQDAGVPMALRIDMEAALRAASTKLGGRPLTFTELGESGEAQTMEARPERWGDAVIVRKDVPTSYHLAVVVDDAWQGVTHVTRGRDLFAATDLHRLLQVLLDLPEPVYHHHRLIFDESGAGSPKAPGTRACASSELRA